MKSQFGGNVALTTNSTETSSAPGTKFVAGKGEGRKSVITERSGALPAHGQGASAARLGHHKIPPLPLGEDAIESLVKCKIQVKHSFGFKTYAQGSMQAYSSISLSAEKDSDKTDRVAFRVGNQVVLHDPHSGSQKFLSG